MIAKMRFFSEFQSIGKATKKIHHLMQRQKIGH